MTDDLRIRELVHFMRPTLVGLHSLLTISNFIQTSKKVDSIILKCSLTFVGMMLYIAGIIFISKCNYYTPSPKEAINIDTGAITTWFRVEITVWFSIIVSNVVFLLLRS
jgi:hypothetical protein